MFRQHVRQGQEEASSQLELFLNQVPILSSLSKEEKLRLLDAFEEQTFPAGSTVVHQGDPGDLFYIIKEGEAVVLQTTSDAPPEEGLERGTVEGLSASKEHLQNNNQKKKREENDDEAQGDKQKEVPKHGKDGESEKDAASQSKKRNEKAIEEVVNKLHCSVRRVNQLFKSDFFGEAALLHATPRAASVVAVTRLVCLTLDRENFIKLLGPLEDLMAREKSPQVVGARLMKLASRGGPSRQQAMVHIKRRRYSRSRGQWIWEMIRAVGHLDEVLALKMTESNQIEKSNNSSAAARQLSASSSRSTGENVRLNDSEDLGTIDASDTKSRNAKNDDIRAETNEDPAVAAAHPVLDLVEGVILGSGAFSRVSVVTEQGSERSYALKRLRKTAVAQCPEHIFCEQAITRNLTHPFCIRQYGSFQDKYHLYFLFDLMPGGDLMDILVAEASIVSMRISRGPFQRGCLAPQSKFLKGLPESVARFYVGSIVLALEYLHQHSIVYRDLKPENVFIDQQGYPKLGDFGFAKVLNSRGRTYTFCGTPGYVAPENILAHGYGTSVDWWGLGVVMFVLLTGKQPFTHPKTDDPMLVMRRIVDEKFVVQFPPYMSASARDIIHRLLERRPSRRLGSLGGGAAEVKRHEWFQGFDWDSLAARRMIPPRQPKDDAAKRIRDLAVEERKHPPRPPKEAPEELAEANRIFMEF